MRTLGRNSYLLLYATTTAAGLLLVAAGNRLVDPLHFYGRPALHHTFVTNERYQNPGLIKNYDYDAVIIGTSHTENFSVAELGKALGWKTIPLSMSGSTVREQFLALRNALATGKVRHVLWGLDFPAFLRIADDLSDDDGTFPLFLYDESLETHLNYLLSFDTLTLSVRALDGRGPQAIAALHTPPDPLKFGEARVLQVWRRMHETRQPATTHRTHPAETPAELVDKNLAANFRPLVAAHPEVDFRLFFPPFSILTYVDDYTRSPDRFPARLAFKRRVVETISKFDNCRLYDFDTAQAVTHNLDNYKDLAHYSRHVNDFMIDAIAGDAYRIDRANCDERLAAFERSVDDFLRTVSAPAGPWRDRLQLSANRLFVRSLAAPVTTTPVRTAAVPDESTSHRESSQRQ